MTAAGTEQRILVETGTPGWYENPTNPGKKVRRTDADQVMSDEQYRQYTINQRDEQSVTQAEKPADQPENGNEAAQQQQAETQAANAATREAAAKAAPQTTTLTSGKVATGATMKIRCAWVDADKRTDAQKALFDANFKGVERGKSYEAVKDAAGSKRSAFPDGTDRTIKVQDGFQVRFKPENQRKWRNELRRRKTLARRAQREASAAKK